MAASLQAERHGLTPFRLSEVPLAVRRDAGRVLARIATEDAKLMERVQIHKAIETPSERVYWVPTAAYEQARKTRRKWK